MYYSYVADAHAYRHKSTAVLRATTIIIYCRKKFILFILLILLLDVFTLAFVLRFKLIRSKNGIQSFVDLFVRSIEHFTSVVQFIDAWQID